jgi:ABC-type branched-subunit amino acid transport system ATPase component
MIYDHDMSLVLGICDRVHVLDVGRLIARGAPAEVRRDPRVVAAYLGETARDESNSIAPATLGSGEQP